MAYCPRCDSENDDAASLCARCGASLSQGTMVMGSLADVSRPKVTLRVVRADGGTESSLEMISDTLTCGRQADLSLPDDPFVAQVQARFFFSGDRLAVEDVAGGNGVFVRLRQERELPMGGELRVGRQRLVLEPIPAAGPGPGGVIMWGSPDAGYAVRLIQILEGGIRGAAFPLRAGENTLGREAGDIAFPGDGFVSGRHALLNAGPEGVRVRDQGSSNGTFIRLMGPAFADNGDQFLVGRQLLRVDVQPHHG